MDQVDEIKQKTDIVSVISERIELKKAGRNYKALCPFHQEKTPSFMVSAELQIYKCFGCGETGDVFSFLEKYEGMTFFESLQYLADKLGIKLKKVNLESQDKRDRLFLLNELTAKFYNYVLLEHKIGKKALSYLTEKRGLKLETVKKFNLGFAPKDSQPLVNFLTKKKGFSKEELIESGTFYPRGNLLQDRFSGRVIFPLYDHRGKTVGFGGRILPVEFGGNDKKDQAKYINSPETLVYKKSHILFGLNLVKEEIKKEKEAVIVEGELDMISSYQAGIRNVVAVKGSALTDEQASLLFRFADKFIFAYDSDDAGVNAIKRGSVVAQKTGAQIKVARLGDYKDPDDMARANPEGLKRAISEASSVWDFLIDLAFERYDAGKGEGKAKISQELVPVLSSIEDKILQAHYVGLVAEKLNVPTTSVFDEIMRRPPKEAPSKENQIFKDLTQKKNRRDLLEERLIALLFQVGVTNLLDFQFDGLIKNRVYKRIIDELREFMATSKQFEPSLFMKKLPAEVSARFSELMLYDIGLLLEDKEKVEEEIENIKKGLKIETLKEELADIQHKMKEAEMNKDAKSLDLLRREFVQKTLQLSALNKSNGVV